MKKLLWLLLLLPSLAFGATETLNHGELTIGPGGEIQSSSSEWYHCHHIKMLSVAAGGSGATWTVPSASTIGGYQLDAVAEYLYFNGKV